MKKLSNIRELGRYKNIVTLQEYNLKKGRVSQRSVDLIFYIYRGNRVFISDKEFYDKHIKI